MSEGLENVVERHLDNWEEGVIVYDFASRGYAEEIMGRLQDKDLSEGVVMEFMRDGRAELSFVENTGLEAALGALLSEDGFDVQDVPSDFQIAQGIAPP